MSQTEKQLIGRIGEDIAADFLQRNGYRVIERNLHVSRNELDIIAEDSEYLVFVEVKTRSCTYSADSELRSAGHAVDFKKRTNTLKAAKDYLYTHHTEKQPRIDVIEVYLLERNEGARSPRLLKINHIRNAFDAMGRRH